MTDRIRTRYSRHDASDYLARVYDIHRKPSTLAKYAVVGGGPRFRKVGAKQVVYDVTDLDAYAQAILSEAVSSTSELTTAA